MGVGDKLMRWQDLNKYFVTILGAGGVITLAILFSGLGELAGVTVTYHSPDQVCKECVAEIHVNSTYWEICFEHSEREDVIFKKQSRSRRLWVNLDKIVLTDPPIVTRVLVPTVKRYSEFEYNNGYWREIKDGDCIKRYHSVYRTAVNKILITGNPEGNRIKWGVPFLGVDPDWIGWDYVYETKTVKEPIYEETVVEVKPVYNEKNQTWSEGYNKIIRKIVGYKTKEVKKIVPNKVKVAGEYYDNANVNEEKGYLYKCNIPLGDRNWKEYPMRQYEIKKGVCNLTWLI